MTPGGHDLAAPVRLGPGPPVAIFDFSRGKQALLTIAQPALGAVLALAGLPSWRVIAIGLPAACAASFALHAPEHDVDTTFMRHPSAVALTLDVYSHALPQQDQDAADRIAELLLPSA